MAGLTIVQATRQARHGLRQRGTSNVGGRQALLATTLVILQPLARLYGRTRRRAAAPDGVGWLMPAVRTASWSSTHWTPLDRRLAAMDEHARRTGARVQAGTPADRWDLRVDGGLLGSARLRATVEEHGHGVQVIRARSWPRFRVSIVTVIVLLLLAGTGAVIDDSWLGAGALMLVAALLGGRAVYEAGRALAVLRTSVARVAVADGSADPAAEHDPAPAWPTASEAVPSLGLTGADRPRAGVDAALVRLATVPQTSVAHNGVGRIARSSHAPTSIRSSAPAPRTPSSPDQ
jgi:hypothetical protein